MAPGVHSIWLMPAAVDAAALERMVEDFSARFDAPRFQPHLTLVEERPLTSMRFAKKD